jgi:hypothetical protein
MASAPNVLRILCINRSTRSRAVFENLTSESTFGDFQQRIQAELKIAIEKQILYFVDVPPRLIECPNAHTTLGTMGVHHNVSIEVREEAHLKKHDSKHMAGNAASAMSAANTATLTCCTMPCALSTERIAPSTASAAALPSNDEQLNANKWSTNFGQQITGYKRAQNESVNVVSASIFSESKDDASHTKEYPSKRLRAAAAAGTHTEEAQCNEENDEKTVSTPLTQYSEQLLPDENGRYTGRRRLLLQRSIDDLYDTVVCAKWRCDACTMENKENADKCARCDTPCSKACRVTNQKGVVPIERIEIVEHILNAPLK